MQLDKVMGIAGTQDQTWYVDSNIILQIPRVNKQIQAKQNKEAGRQLNQCKIISYTDIEIQLLSGK